MHEKFSIKDLGCLENFLDNETEAAKVDPGQLRRLIGSLLYLTAIRPDIAYPVNIFSQFTHETCKSHLDAAIGILRSIKGTAGQGVFSPSDGPITLKTYCDSDSGGCTMSRRSQTGYVVLLGGHPSLEGPRSNRSLSIIRKSQISRRLLLPKYFGYAGY